MATTISVLGGVGLFLLGMTVMTGGLKALAGSGLRAVLSKAAILGRLRHAARAIVQRNDHDDHRSRECGHADFAPRVGPRTWRERRHNGNRLACRTHRCPRVTHRRRAAYDLYWAAGAYRGQVPRLLGLGWYFLG